MRIMHGIDGAKIVSECLPHTTQLVYYMNPTNCIWMWLFVDGHVQFVTYAAGTANVTVVNNINVSLLEALASRNGGEAISPP